jgi:ribosome maturation factor RimP
MANNEIKKVVESFGATLYGVETEKAGESSTYRVLIQKIGGVDVETCENISRVLSPLFDLDPPVKGQYYLEISSPGVERNLNSKEHFAMSIGEKVKIKTKEAVKLDGVLKSIIGDTITIETASGIITVLFDDLLKAKTKFEW